MGDSNAMTIDFLRARLLSERAVSRTARQRADELARRVIELEEKLQVVSTQRKKAEKATADVLTILEIHGISDASEDYYLSSDNDETPRTVAKANGQTKAGESSLNLKQLGNELEDISSPKTESSIVFGRRLSWKGCKDSSPSLDKFKEASMRRRSGLVVSMAKPSNHSLGKSCRQIRQRNQRFEASEGMNSSQQSYHGNDEVSSGEMCQNAAGDGPDILNGSFEFNKEKVQPPDTDTSVLVDERNAVNAARHQRDEHGEETNMEKALQYQEQLIGQYEAVEKAQREWEEKFQENRSSALETCDPSNHSEVTEEAEEKPQVPGSPAAVTVPYAEAKSELRDASITKTSPAEQHELSVPALRAEHGHFLPTSYQELPSKVRDDLNQSHTFHLPNDKGKNQKVDSCAQPPVRTPFSTDDSLRTDTPVKQVVGNPHPTVNALVPHVTTASMLTGVLDSLKQAKLTLHKQISRDPSSDNRHLGSTMEPFLLKPESRNGLDIPGGFSGLFRLPSDISLATYAEGNMPGSSTWASSARFHPRSQPMHPAGNMHQYIGSNLSFPKDDRLVSGQFFDVGQRTISPDLHMYPCPDRSTHDYPPHQLPGTLPNLGGIPKPHPSSGLTPQVSRSARLSHNDRHYAGPGSF
ncbi:hypothetical protein MLD38_008599 [Melastoma candidum]|uniref:Uncharacterized protein n=1 Tax=Melastoma candidum TaxID=119954 RepID=A0ACB9RUG7_9MYRT|nr:hypothetical protein MLD38_008599 [Melastoma candidum]